jgi:hypothetical protein
MKNCKTIGRGLSKDVSRDANEVSKFVIYLRICGVSCDAARLVLFGVTTSRVLRRERYVYL